MRPFAFWPAPVLATSPGCTWVHVRTMSRPEEEEPAVVGRGPLVFPKDSWRVSLWGVWVPVPPVPVRIPAAGRGIDHQEVQRHTLCPFPTF